jgi:hypothetical protein
MLRLRHVAERRAATTSGDDLPFTPDEFAAFFRSRDRSAMKMLAEGLSKSASTD